VSSHREAPSISKDPVADNTDTYAFVSDGGTVTLIANFLPVEAPAGGPNFYEFGDDVTYQIHVDNDGDGQADITYRFEFRTEITNPATFLYNTGPIDSLDSPSWSRRQTYTLTKVTYTDRRSERRNVLARGLVVPPCNVGPRSTPNYASLADAATYTLASGERVFAGQRAEGFFVDLGSVFDLGTLRPVQSLHLLGMPNAPGVDALADVNVHSIAIQVPISHLTRDGSTPTDPATPVAVIGVYAAASRRRGRVLQGDGRTDSAGPLQQVSRLGNPLFNEVIVPMALKDRWNALDPDDDDEFAGYVARPELASLLPVLYPGVFPNLAALNASGVDRADLLAILLTGIPAGLIPGFQNLTGTTQADLLRLNVAIPPTASPKRLGLLDGDLAGFPNGRRLGDDVVTIELRAVAGATYPLVDPTFVPDGAVAVIEDGTFGDPGRAFLDVFPFLGLPYSGFDVPAAS
jgi:hypothetical protein